MASKTKEIIIPDMDISEIPIDIVGTINRTIEKKRRIFPCHSNRASELGHPCTRFLVLKRTRWTDLVPPELGLLKIFNEGNLHEKDIIRQLAESDIGFIHQQVDFSIDDLNITGHIDGQVVIDDSNSIPGEIKSTNPYDFVKINTVKDMVGSSRVWWQKYPGQMTLYLHGTKKKIGVFLLKNKLNGEIKQIFCKYDPVYADSLFEKARVINEYIVKKTLPDPIEPQENICGRCGFLSICTPDRKFGPPLSVKDDSVLEDWLEEREAIKEAVRRHKELDKNIKHAVEGQDNLMIGNFHITRTLVEKNGYTVKPSQYWKTNILYIG